MEVLINIVQGTTAAGCLWILLSFAVPSCERERDERAYNKCLELHEQFANCQQIYRSAK